MDLGGASTQITFETQEAIESPANDVTLRLYGQTYKVYTHSFLCYGLDQVLKRVLSKVLKVMTFGCQPGFSMYANMCAPDRGFPPLSSPKGSTVKRVLLPVNVVVLFFSMTRTLPF